jgi:hypothetical protein
MSRLRRTLTWYERDGDALVGEVDLKSIPLAQLRRWFKVSASNQMVDSYPVGRQQAEHLQVALGRPIHLQRYSYFVECSQVEAKSLASTAARELKEKMRARNGGGARRAAG